MSSRTPRRLRSLAMAGAAIACGGLAISLVERREAKVRAQVGPLIPALVAATAVERGKQLTRADVAGMFVRRPVPRSYLPSDAIAERTEAVGYRTQIELRPGDYLTSGVLAVPGRHQSRLANRARQGQRLVEVGVSGGASLVSQLQQGALVDVLVTSDRAGPPRTYLALQRVEVIQASEAGADGSTSGGASDRPADLNATLRVSLRQAIMLAAAQNFAREIRIVPRPAGDRSLQPALAVTPAQLRP